MAKPPQFPFLDQGQEFAIFSNGYLDFSANIIIGDMVLVCDVQQPLEAPHLKGLRPFL